MAHIARLEGWVVLVATDWYHKHGVNRGRRCEKCGARWTVLRENGQFRAWKDNRERTQEDVLDFIGNNVVVRCCQLQ